jgi:hypothetical protein
MPDPTAAAVAPLDPWMAALAGQGGPAILGVFALVELHRIRSAVDRLTDRLSTLEGRFYATVTQRPDPMTER